MADNNDEDQVNWAAELIDMYQENIDRHGHDPEQAKAEALRDYGEAIAIMQAGVEKLTTVLNEVRDALLVGGQSEAIRADLARLALERAGLLIPEDESAGEAR